MEAMTQFQVEENTNDKTTNLRVNVTFDVSMSNNSGNGSAAFAKEVQELLKNNQGSLMAHLQSKKYKVKVQARRNRAPKNKTV
jgi:hypothetical protein